MAILNHYGTTDQGIPLVILPPPQDGKEVPLPAITYSTSLKMGSPELAKYLQEHYPLCPHGRILEWYSSNDILVCKIHTGNRAGELPIGGTVLVWNTDVVSKTIDNNISNDFRTYHG